MTTKKLKWGLGLDAREPQRHKMMIRRQKTTAEWQIMTTKRLKTTKKKAQTDHKVTKWENDDKETQKMTSDRRNNHRETQNDHKQLLNDAKHLLETSGDTKWRQSMWQKMLCLCRITGRRSWMKLKLVFSESRFKKLNFCKWKTCQIISNRWIRYQLLATNHPIISDFIQFLY